MNSSNVFTLFVSGDFCPAEKKIVKLLKNKSAETVFGDLCEVIRNADISITNLECPLTLSQNKITKIGPNLKSHPDMASLLKSVGFNMVTLANNHIYDYGQKGLLETLETLKKYDLSYVGAGLDINEAKKIFYIEIKNIKLAIVNIAEIEFSSADLEHGGANPMDLIDNTYQIKEAQKNADHVLVIIHGGHEHYHYPSPETLKRYRFYAKSGASAIVAHHTHAIGGYEKHNGIPIFYSLGNFFFPTCEKVQSLWYEGYALLFKISKESLEFEILPYEQCKGNTLSINIDKTQKILKKLDKINAVLADNIKLTEKWEKFIEEHSLYYLTKASGFGRYKVAILRRLGILNYFYRNSHLNHILQIIRCKAHSEGARDALLQYLTK